MSNVACMSLAASRDIRVPNAQTARAVSGPDGDSTLLKFSNLVSQSSETSGAGAVVGRSDSSQSGRRPQRVCLGAFGACKLGAGLVAARARSCSCSCSCRLVLIALHLHEINPLASLYPQQCLAACFRRPSVRPEPFCSVLQMSNLSLRIVCHRLRFGPRARFGSRSS